MEKGEAGTQQETHKFRKLRPHRRSAVITAMQILQNATNSLTQYWKIIRKTEEEKRAKNEIL